jgi:predicted dehydrogenase
MNKLENGHELDRREFIVNGSMAALMMMAGAIELKAAENPADSKPAGPPVPCGVIGCGTWGRDILRTLARFPNAPVLGICDTYEPYLRRCAETAPKGEKYADYRQLLDNKAIQAVIVATPTHLHRDIAISALQAGKHVYCEAPLATSIADAAAIAKAAKAANKQVFQAGLLFRSNLIHQHVLQFVRTGALGKNVFSRGQWHKRQSWRRTAANPEREKAANWHLNRESSIGLAGEIGTHYFDSAGWFLKARPVSVNGFGGLMAWNDGRDVFDTIQAALEFPNGVRFLYDSTLANSFDGSYEVHSGADASILIRDGRAWMIKEVDAPLLGWEVNARKEEFTPGKDTGLALIANSTKLLAEGKEPSKAEIKTESPLYYAMEEFIANINEPKSKPSAGFQEAFEAAVVAIKTNEAILSGQKTAFTNEMFDL